MSNGIQKFVENLYPKSHVKIISMSYSLGTVNVIAEVQFPEMNWIEISCKIQN